MVGRDGFAAAVGGGLVEGYDIMLDVWRQAV